MTAGSLLTDRHTGTWAQEPLGSGAAHFRFPKAFKSVYLSLFTFKIALLQKNSKKITFFLRISIFCCTFAPKTYAEGNVSLFIGGFSDILNSVY